MSDSVVRLQSDGTLKHQSVPPLLPAYNKYMGGVDIELVKCARSTVTTGNPNDTG